MSVKVMGRVFGNFHPESDVGDRLVLLVLADSAHDDGITWVSQEEIAAKSRLSERHVRRCIRELDDRGEIEARKAQRGRRRINVYRVVCAPSEPDYDRLPFELSEPFSPARFTINHAGTFRLTDADSAPLGPLARAGSTTGQESRSSEEGRPDAVDRDDRTSEVETGDPSSSRTRKGPVRGRPSSSEQSLDDVDDGPPKLTKVNGRDLAFDALAEVCGVDPGGNRAREVGIALNGSKRSGLALGIRALAWRDYVDLYDGVEQAPLFEEFLASSIRGRARRYQEAMRGAALTPLALAKWWTDLEGRASDAATRAADEAVRLAEEGR